MLSHLHDSILNAFASFKPKLQVYLNLLVVQGGLMGSCSYSTERKKEVQGTQHNNYSGTQHSQRCTTHT